MSSKKNPGTVWLVNQFAPPDRAPTARLVGELATGLQELGWQVRFLACAAGYRAGPVAGWRRWWRDLRAHATLLRKGLMGSRADIIVCLSDPPALIFTIACAALLRPARVVYWPMDVYPEVAAALGALSGRSAIYRCIKCAVDWAVARCATVVCLDEDMRQKFVDLGAPVGPVIAPWPPAQLTIRDAAPEPDSDLIRWIYSGNLGRAHEFETLLHAQRLIEESERPFELVFQGGGALRANAEKLAAELRLKNCRWLDYADDTKLVSTLLQAHACVATQRPEMRGLLWPSKLALLEMLPRPVVWVGPLNGAIADRLREKPGLCGLFAPGDHRGLASWLSQNESEIRRGARSVSSGDDIRKQIDAARADAVSCWHDLLASLLV